MGVMLPLSGTVCLNNLSRKASGALLNIYRDGTDTPAVGYTDPDLANPHQDPIAADGNGRWPAIYLDYGAYRLKIRTAAGSVLFDADGANFPAPTDQEVTVDEDALLKTGEVFFKFRDGTRTGAVRANGRTIGSAVSGASERANADTEPLFAELYNALSDAVCPVSGGRGANAAADFAANKTLTLPDLRGRAPFGLDTMGVLPAGRFNAVVPFPVGSATTPGSVAGANHVTLDSTMIPTHTHALTSVTVGTGGSLPMASPAAARPATGRMRTPAATPHRTAHTRTRSRATASAPSRRRAARTRLKSPALVVPAPLPPARQRTARTRMASISFRTAPTRTA
jgi:microcystin-dependent protein